MIKLPWVSRKEYDHQLGIQEAYHKQISHLLHELGAVNKELEQCWKFINKNHSNKGHWLKQKRVGGRFAK